MSSHLAGLYNQAALLPRQRQGGTQVLASQRNLALLQAVKKGTGVDAAREFGVSPSRVSQIVKRHKFKVYNAPFTPEESEDWIVASEGIEAALQELRRLLDETQSYWQTRNRIMTAVEKRTLAESSERTAGASRPDRRLRDSGIAVLLLATSVLAIFGGCASLPPQ